MSHLLRVFMNISFYFQKTNKNRENKLRNYLTEKKLKRLTRLLRHGSLPLADLRVHTEYFQKHNAFLVKLSLKFAKYALVAEERSHDILKGLDLALDRLIDQLRKVESIKHDK